MVISSVVILHAFHHYNSKNQAYSACGNYVNGEGGGLGANVEDINKVNCKKCLKIIEKDSQNAIHTEK